MNKKVAIIGGGIFGVQAALEIANNGFGVTIYEKREDILLEATANSQNRLHLGLHYPRDLKTAIQSRIGFETFRAAYPDCVKTGFDNFYLLASENSKVTKSEFIEFTKKAGISIEEVDLNSGFFGSESYKKFSAAWKCNEGVIDIDVLRDILKSRIKDSGIELLLNTCIETANIDSDNKWTLKSQDGTDQKFDWVIRATYGTDSIKSNSLAITEVSYEFHKTLILEVSSDNPTIGLTVVDGDFLTILPKGFSENFLVYAPSLSVLGRHLGNQAPNNWNYSPDDYSRAGLEILKRSAYFFPDFKISKVLNNLQTIRSIQPNVSSTDRRTSEVRMLDHNFLNIWSGKIDHAIDVAKQVASEIS